jgi:Lrp/AsnC family leucine-responsive transcriptional regulator
MAIKIDEVDKKIISGLSANAEMSHAELADLCGVTRQTVASRIRRLENEGIIRKYKAVVDYEKVGLQSFILLFLKLDTSDSVKAADFINSIKNDPNVIMDVSITGEWDVMLLLAFGNVKEYESYTSKLRVLMGPMLKDSKSHVVLNFYKTSDDYLPFS